MVLILFKCHGANSENVFKTPRPEPHPEDLTPAVSSYPYCYIFL